MTNKAKLAHEIEDHFRANPGDITRVAQQIARIREILFAHYTVQSQHPVGILIETVDVLKDVAAETLESYPTAEQ